jgi:hypothetical protein
MEFAMGTLGNRLLALIVAATARARGMEILHYDRDFDTIARFTEQPARWIVPPGTV